MSTLFAKLNLKGHSPIHVLGAPASFEPELEALRGTEVRRALAPGEAVTFALAFVQTQEAVDEAAAALTAAAAPDALLWFAYPKASSRRYACAFNRDTGWASLGAAGYEGVRQVAIDADWSAIRFRDVRFIKRFTRAPERAGSAEGKRRASER